MDKSSVFSVSCIFSFVSHFSLPYPVDFLHFSFNVRNQILALFLSAFHNSSASLGSLHIFNTFSDSFFFPSPHYIPLHYPWQLSFLLCSLHFIFSLTFSIFLLSLVNVLAISFYLASCLFRHSALFVSSAKEFSASFRLLLYHRLSRSLFIFLIFANRLYNLLQSLQSPNLSL